MLVLSPVLGSDFKAVKAESSLAECIVTMKERIGRLPLRVNGAVESAREASGSLQRDPPAQGRILS